jgi:UDP-N-acetylmuramyl pentapeptide synthase
MMQLSQVARVVSGRPSRPLASETVTGVSTDTRSIRAGDLFFALRGANFDAHDFLAQAFEKGAAAGTSPGGTTADRPGPPCPGAVFLNRPIPYFSPLGLVVFRFSVPAGLP